MFGQVNGVDFNALAVWVNVQVNPNVAYFQIYENYDNAGGAVTQTGAFAATDNFRFTISYWV